MSRRSASTPFWYRAERDAAAELIKIQNEKLAEFCAALPKKKPTQYLKDGQLYFDSIMFTPEGMRHLIAETGVRQVMIGTDYPFPWNKVPVDHVLSTPGLSDDDKMAILGGTAAKLLGIKA